MTALHENQGIVCKLKVRNEDLARAAEPIKNLLNRFVDSTLLIIRLKLSAAKVNRKGVRGSPCLRPLEAGKNPVGDQLMI